MSLGKSISNFPLTHWVKLTGLISFLQTDLGQPVAIIYKVTNFVPFNSFRISCLLKQEINVDLL